MANSFSFIYKLNRLDSPTGYLLVFFPAAFGLLLSFPEFKELLLLPTFFVGSITSRGAGCIINDLLDRNIDIHVARTKKRVIASGLVTTNSAMIVLYVSLLMSLLLLLSLSLTSIIIGFVAFLMILGYPLAKRFTYFPQIFLGLTFNLGILISYASTKDIIEFEAIYVYIACVFWTIGYDTIYAFMDLKDDIRIGVKSMAVFLERKSYKLWIASCYGIFLIIMILVFLSRNEYISMFGCALSSILLSWQVITLDIQSTKNCSLRFKNNSFVGLIIFLAMVMEFITPLFKLNF